MPVGDTGIPFIAVCRDHLDRNLQANSELVCPKAVRGYVQGDGNSSVSFSIQMLQSKQQLKLVRKHTVDSLSPRGVRVARVSRGRQINISITEVHVTLKHPPAEQFLQQRSLQAYVAN